MSVDLIDPFVIIAHIICFLIVPYMLLFEVSLIFNLDASMLNVYPLLYF